jgi:hypothetical protein
LYGFYTCPHTSNDNLLLVQLLIQLFE